MRQARNFARAALGAMGVSKGGFAQREGPKIISATRTGTTIQLNIALDPGATALKRYVWHDNNARTALNYTEDAPSQVTDMILGRMFTVYPAGKSWYSTPAPAWLAITGGTIVDPPTISGAEAQINLTLTTDPGAGAGLDVWYGADRGVTQLEVQNLFDHGTISGSVTHSIWKLPAIKDDSDDGDGLTYGRDMQQTNYPIYAPPPTPATQSLSLTQPADTAAGAWIPIKGTGTGLSLAPALAEHVDASSIEVSVAGGAWAVPTSLRVNNNNDWSAFVQAPASPASGVTIAVRRAGHTPADDTKTINVLAYRDTLPASIKAHFAVAFDTLNIGSLWQDAAKTVRAAARAPVRVWADSLGTTANDLRQDFDTDTDRCPYYVLRRPEMGASPGALITGGTLATYWGAGQGSFPTRSDRTKDRPYLQFDIFQVASDSYGQSLAVGSAPFLTTLGSSHTFYVVYENMNSLAMVNMMAGLTTTGAKFWRLSATSPVFKMGLRSSGQPNYAVTRSGPLNATPVTVSEPTAIAHQYRMAAVIVRFNSSTGQVRIWSSLQNTEATGTTASGVVTFNTFLLGGQLTTATNPSFAYTKVAGFGVLDTELAGDPTTDVSGDIYDLKTYLTRFPS
jgi:hypothetical protein